MDLGNNVTQIILAVIAIFAVGIAIKVIRKNNNKVNQKDISIGGDGDVVGRDKTTKK